MPKARKARPFKPVKPPAKGRARTDSAAEELAARLVKQQRPKQGRAKPAHRRAPGSPNSPLETRTKQELYNRARELEIAGRSQMSKGQLVVAIRKRG